MDNQTSHPEPPSTQAQLDQNREVTIQTPTTNDQSQRSRIRYRTEYLDQSTNDVVWEENSRTPIVNPHDGTDFINDPAFEILTIYRARGDSKNTLRSSEAGGRKLQGPPPRSFGTPARHKLRIYSPALRNALNSVVQYYPSQPLNGDVIEVNWPYPVLVHHYEDLVEFRTRVLSKEPTELCVREALAADDIQALLTYLDQTVMDAVRAETARVRRGFLSFDNLWYSYKPGTAVLSNIAEGTTWRAFVVRDIWGGTFVDPPDRWVIRGWSLIFDGMYLGREEYSETVEKFSGEVEHDHWVRFIPNTDNVNDEEAKKLVDYGKLYWNLLEKQCKFHAGDSCIFPYNKVSQFEEDKLVASYTPIDPLRY